MSEQDSSLNPYRSAETIGVGRDAGIGVSRIVRVSVMLMVHGVLLLFASGVAGLAVFGFTMIPQEELGSDVVSLQMMMWIYGGISVLLLMVGLLQVMAGLRNYYFRNRGLGVLALGVGLLSMFSFFCLPTSLALAIYGIIVYLDPATKQVFDMRQAGVDRDEIISRFGRPYMPT